MSSSISEIEAELAQSRAALKANLSALADRLTVAHVVGDVLLTRRALAGAAKVVAPFAAVGIAGVVLKYAARSRETESASHLSDAIGTRWRSLLSHVRSPRRRSSDHPLLLVAAALAAGGVAAALLPVTRRERTALRTPLRYAAARAAHATRLAATEANDFSNKAARVAERPDPQAAASS